MKSRKDAIPTDWRAEVANINRWSIMEYVDHPYEFIDDEDGTIFQADEALPLMHRMCDRIEALQAALAARDAEWLNSLKRYRPVVQKHPHTRKGFIAVMTDRDDPRESEWSSIDTRCWIKFSDLRKLLTPQEQPQ